MYRKLMYKKPAGGIMVQLTGQNIMSSNTHKTPTPPFLSCKEKKKSLHTGSKYNH